MKAKSCLVFLLGFWESGKLFDQTAWRYNKQWDKNYTNFECNKTGICSISTLSN